MHNPLTKPTSVFEDLFSVLWRCIVGIYGAGFLSACFSNDLRALAGGSQEEYAEGLLQRVMSYRIKTQGKDFKEKNW